MFFLEGGMTWLGRLQGRALGLGETLHTMPPVDRILLGGDRSSEFRSRRSIWPVDWMRMGEVKVT
jgi:hypothetical protein